MPTAIYIQAIISTVTGRLFAFMAAPPVRHHWVPVPPRAAAGSPRPPAARAPSPHSRPCLDATDRGCTRAASCRKRTANSWLPPSSAPDQVNKIRREGANSGDHSENNDGCSDVSGLGDFDPRLKLQRGSYGPGNQAQLLGTTEQAESTLAVYDRGDFQIGLHDDLAEIVAGLRLAHCAAGLHLQISEIEPRRACDRVHGGGVAAGDGCEQKFLGCPSAFQAA